MVVCSNGYPDEFKKNIKIENLKSIGLQSDDYLFHAGTSKKNEEVYATGGRVLNFVSISDNFNDAKIRIIKNLDKLNWSGGFYRKDIGYKVII
jgi:phosphoribosylamine--glycine ligase